MYTVIIPIISLQRHLPRKYFDILRVFRTRCDLRFRNPTVFRGVTVIRDQEINKVLTQVYLGS